MKEIKFIVEGDPQPKERARFKKYKNKAEDTLKVILKKFKISDTQVNNIIDLFKSEIENEDEKNMYTPKRTQQYEAKVKTAYMHTVKSREMSLKYIELHLVIYFRIPQNANKETRMLMLNGYIRPGKIGDADNLLKALMDGLNGAAYEDDCQVCKAYVERLYDLIPRVEVTLKELPGPEDYYNELKLKEEETKQLSFV